MVVSNGISARVAANLLMGTKFGSKGPIGEELRSRTRELIRKLESLPNSEDTARLIRMLDLSKRRNKSGLHEYALSLAKEYLGESRNAGEKPRSRGEILAAANTLIVVIEEWE